MVDRPKAQATTERAAAADYVATISSELASIARRHGLDALGFLLDMARLEAENAARMNGGGRGGRVSGSPITGE
jgi:hypothetical protein